LTWRPGPSTSRCRVELSDGSLIIGPPKSAAAKRVVTLADVIMSEMATHLQEYAAPGADALVFVGPKGAPLRRPNFTRFWRPAIRQAGLDGTHFHDLRHAGNTLAATTGATLRELMGRMGHASTRAALIYQHQAAGRDQVIADALGRLTEAELRRASKTSGTQRARKQEQGS
jgi:integrase